MPNLSKNRYKIMPATIEYGGERIRFDYYPWFIDSEEYRQLIKEGQEAGRDGNDTVSCTYELMSKVVHDWNLEAEYVQDGDGGEWRLARNGEESTTRKIPVTQQGMAEVGVPEQMLIRMENKASEETINGGLQAKKS